MRKYFLALVILLSAANFPQRNLYSINDDNTAKFEFTDFGNMWTFDAVPVDTFRARYNFTPDENWLNKVMRSALQFGSGCSGAFVSADGLIMTNHHCGRNRLKDIQKEGEDLLRDGFYAKTLQEERKVPGLYVDQLMFIEDVTNEILDAFDKGDSPKKKLELRNEKISELQKKYSEETGLLCKIINLYNGKKFSLYGYRRYDDIRLVMSPDFQIAATGWDWDNFTYPRYELDFMFFRAYENGKPVKSEYFFPIAKTPVQENETVFIIGRPGHTDRQISVRELNYLKDYVYKQRFIKYNALYNAHSYLFENCKDSSRHSELLNAVMGFGNGRKSYAGRLLGLKNKFYLAKKIDFENQLREKTAADKNLQAEYGDVWEKIDAIIAETEKISNRYAAYTLSPFFMPDYIQMTIKLKNYLDKKQKYSREEAEEIASEIVPENFDDKFVTEKNKQLTEALIRIYTELIPEEEITKSICGNSDNVEKIAESIIDNSGFASKEKARETIIAALVNGEKPDNAFFDIVTVSEKKTKNLYEKRKALESALAVENQRLSKLIAEVFGDVIPPDATLTLRISDGKVKGYEYNGTLAPAKTSFYGLWDRYVSFGKKEYPWGLHERWQIPPKELNLETPIGFASTNDIVGGNSGSSVINTKGEVVGLVHDGNIESLAGHFIFDTECNRAVSSDIFGILEALKYVYKTPELVNELKNGKLNE